VDGVTATSYVDDERTVKVTMATSSPHVWPAPRSLPPNLIRAAQIEIQQAVDDARRRVVVLDDDPKGHLRTVEDENRAR